jgi:hypothetical protein
MYIYVYVCVHQGSTHDIYLKLHLYYDILLVHTFRQHQTKFKFFNLLIYVATYIYIYIYIWVMLGSNRFLLLPEVPLE